MLGRRRELDDVQPTLGDRDPVSGAPMALRPRGWPSLGAREMGLVLGRGRLG